jgi:hypothetical protein
MAVGYLLPAMGALAVSVLTFVVVLVALRYDRLGRLGGYGSPAPGQFLSRLLKGLESTLFLWPTTRTWQAVASVMATCALAGGMATTRWRHGRRALAAGGAALIIGLLLNVPAALQSKVSYGIFEWPGLASGSVISVLALGLGAALLRGNRHALFLMAAGLVVAFGFDAPFILVSKREQYHLLTLGAVVAFIGASSAL